MLKLTGAIMICISSFLFGLKKAAILERRVQLLNDMEKSLILLGGEIKYASATLPEALLSVSRRTRGAIGDFYRAVYQNIRMESDKGFGEVWNEAVDLFLCDEEAMKGDADLLKEPGNQLGHLDISMQLKTIELCISRINLRQDEAIESNKAKSRVYKTFAAACGVLLTLVLL